MATEGTKNGIMFILAGIVGLIGGTLASAKDFFDIYDWLNPISVHAAVYPTPVVEGEKYFMVATLTNKSDTNVKVLEVKTETYINGKSENNKILYTKSHPDWNTSDVPSKQTVAVMDRESVPNAITEGCGVVRMNYIFKTTEGNYEKDVFFSRKCSNQP